MAALHILTLLLLSVSWPVCLGSVRVSRSLLELSGLMKCSTGRHALAYTVYGCYCGLGGQGWPRDTADWCCHKHDCCYAKAVDKGCNSKSDRYRWSCGTYEQDCADVDDPCEKMLCVCDRDAARCLKKAPYNLEYSVYPHFLCGADFATCAYY
ncbi:phospholipase A2-like [Colossoma macropomum]|uniref:phospholipase A2-like n=1 Tax=Colossoma macropomum TaxID=42526 RepID=UPI00186523A1|nr:phospholipase A2-like [Colossoma macropomum]